MSLGARAAVIGHGSFKVALAFRHHVGGFMFTICSEPTKSQDALRLGIFA